MALGLKSIFTIRFFDEVCRKKTIIHSIHPLIKLIVTICYLFVVVAGGKYSFGRLLPLLLYPFILIPLSEIPIKPFFPMLFVVMPLIVGIGIFNPVFDTKTITLATGIEMSMGWISFATLILKAILTVLATFILFATTGILNIAIAMQIVFIPKMIVLQLLLMYRYIILLVSEISRVFTAYSLRAPGQKGIKMKVWGPMVGRLLMHSFDMAQRVFIAMKLRGFNGTYHTGKGLRIRFTDIIYLVILVSFLTAIYVIDLPALLGRVITGGFY